jgi:hypothetical protein
MVRLAAAALFAVRVKEITTATAIAAPAVLDKSLIRTSIA